MLSNFFLRKLWLLKGLPGRTARLNSDNAKVQIETLEFMGNVLKAWNRLLAFEPKRGFHNQMIRRSACQHSFVINMLRLAKQSNHKMSDDIRGEAKAAWYHQGQTKHIEDGAGVIRRVADSGQSQSTCKVDPAGPQHQPVGNAYRLLQKLIESKVLSEVLLSPSCHFFWISNICHRQ